METYYSKEHEWVKIKDGVASVGISEHAARELGDITFVELPQVGKTVKQFDVLAGIESVKAASDIYAPLSGKVIKINEALEGAPEIVNEAAEEAGWIAWLEPADLGEVKNLMSKEEYDNYLKGLA
ncbi:glycine cleavage system lipoyl carrier protein GcvH [Geotalea daltonii FRC-32]|uniref:Glycine cleavage system H protein n=1 Tax=Geotalea daltonii (strain DSM 22248 / JCM 15807 / FRC-32) TaxID=316067 RepID=B9M3X5_GEODF|nr:glycine cleavage system protein GcvH [Geotalea daltonii]ACM19618.1 glycine cleavage system lipoyl carrier protein GcvH [Geotalea daltonii FRC-32]